MAQVTSPIILDSTGQQIHSDLQQIKNVLTTPSAAEDITFDNTGTGMQADDVQDAITELKSNLSNLETLKKTVSGAIVTFTDGAFLPMPSLKVGIEPQQDLHGYDSPWVGGAGKNKLKDNLYYDRTLNGVTFARQADGGIKITGTATQNFRVNYSNTVELKTGQYILSGGATKIEIALQVFGYVTTTEKSITVESDSTYEAWLYLYGNTAYNTIIYPMLRPSNTDSTYAPYSNECPISGHTEANVVVSPTTDAEDGTTYTIQFKDGDNPLTVYGGTLDVVSGELKVVPYYDSYNDETLEGEWISDRDVYAVGTTPTIGAQVVNIGATPTTYQLTPTQVKSLLGTNNVWADTGNIELTYLTNSTLNQTIYDMVKIMIEQSA